MTAEWAAVVSTVIGLLSAVILQYVNWRWPRGYHRKGDSEANQDTPGTSDPDN